MELVIHRVKEVVLREKKAGETTRWAEFRIYTTDGEMFEVSCFLDEEADVTTRGRLIGYESL